MMPDAALALGVGARSEKGRRQENQDKMTAFSTSLGSFYIVADGMGGHRGGAEASHKVVEGYRNHLGTFHEAADFAELVQRATALTNAEILEEGSSGDPSVAGMGSTVVLVMLRSDARGMELISAHIGDSRAYLLRQGALTRLTRDHSAVQRLVDENTITAEAARNHPGLNVLTRALGKQPNVEIEVGSSVSLHTGDTVLLCTDGLWGHLSDEELIHELSMERSASETADAIVELALANGSDDNVTVQLLRLEGRQPMLVSPEEPAPQPAPRSPADPVRTTQTFSALDSLGPLQPEPLQVAQPRPDLSAPPVAQKLPLWQGPYGMVLAALVLLALGIAGYLSGPKLASSLKNSGANPTPAAPPRPASFPSSSKRDAPREVPPPPR